MQAQITVLDAGGQYCHLIARKVRELGVSAEVRPSDTSASELATRKGIIISGGPASVYETGSPQIDPATLALGVPVLGICYGQQLMAYVLDGRVDKGDKGEYGFAELELTNVSNPLFEGLPAHQQVWMSHRDSVSRLPTGYELLGRTSTCAIASIGDPVRKQYGVQFHPEVIHTRHGAKILSNFIRGICGCQPDWNPEGQVEELEAQIRRIAGDRNVFFFVSGGVDSTVAYTLCLRALGPDRVWGTYVDTGLMREGETQFVEGIFRSLGAQHFHVEHAEDRFLGSLENIVEPEAKRKIIGQQFVEVQERILQSGHFTDANWILGQGTIYPDTIESGGSAKADLIKTHHNRVAGIQKLIDENRLVEPLASFYKDEVRILGRKLGLPEEFLERHPFPGPGLAIRCLCSDTDSAPLTLAAETVLPIKSVGVQGDSRSYRDVLALAQMPSNFAAQSELTNRLSNINRVVALVGSRSNGQAPRVARASLTRGRVETLRRADAIVRELSHSSGFDKKVWQFPVVLVPFGVPGCSESVVLRPIFSVDGMTADAVPMEKPLLDEMSRRLLEVPGVYAVFYDVTNKPPATIEWE